MRLTEQRGASSLRGLANSGLQHDEHSEVVAHLWSTEPNVSVPLLGLMSVERETYQRWPYGRAQCGGGAAKQQDGTQDGTQGLDKQREVTQVHTRELDTPEALPQPARDRPGQSVHAMDSRMHQQAFQGVKHQQVQRQRAAFESTWKAAFLTRVFLTSAHRNGSATQREFRRNAESHALRYEALFTQGVKIALGLLASAGD